MRSIKFLILFALFIISPILFGAGTGGFPSKPTFKGMTVENQPSPMGAIDYYTGLKIRQSNTTVGSGFANKQSAFNYSLDDQDGSGLNLYLDNNTKATIGFWTDHWSQGADGCSFPTDPGCFIDRGGWFANNNCVFLVEGEGDNSAIGRFTIYGNTAGSCNSSGGGYFNPVALFRIDNFPAVPVLSFPGTFSSNKSCPTGLDRKSPNFCGLTGDPSDVLLVRDTCTTVAAPATAAISTKALRVRLRAHVAVANAVGQRESIAEFYTNNTCATRLRQGARAQYWEEPASAAALNAASDTIELSVPVDASRNIYIKQTDDAANTGSAFYAITGSED